MFGQFLYVYAYRRPFSAFPKRYKIVGNNSTDKIIFFTLRHIYFRSSKFIFIFQFIIIIVLLIFEEN